MLNAKGKGSRYCSESHHAKPVILNIRILPENEYLEHEHGEACGVRCLIFTCRITKSYSAMERFESGW